jgi:hypothetical protein
MRGRRKFAGRADNIPNLRKILCNYSGACSFNNLEPNFTTNVYARTVQLAGEDIRVFEREEILHARSTAIEGVGAEAQSQRAC